MNFGEYSMFTADSATRGHNLQTACKLLEAKYKETFHWESDWDWLQSGTTLRVIGTDCSLEQPWNGVIKFSSLMCFKNSLLLCDLSKYVSF